MFVWNDMCGLSQDINLFTFEGHWHLGSSCYLHLQWNNFNKLKFKHVKLEALAMET